MAEAAAEDTPGQAVPDVREAPVTFEIASVYIAPTGAQWTETRLELPITTESGNIGHGRENPFARSKRVAREREAVAWGWPWQLKQRRGRWNWPVTVRLVRFGPKLLDEGDNLPGALKAIRDEVAKQMGATDGPKDKRIRWRYGQVERPGLPSVRIELRERAK